MLVSPLHDCLEQLVGVALAWLQLAFQNALHLRIGTLDHALVDGAGGAIDRDVIPLIEHSLARCQGFLLVVNFDIASATDTDLA